MAKVQAKAERKSPETVALTSIQQSRLSALTGVEEAKIKGNSIAQLSDTLRWEINPKLFLFRKVCGKVVKKDPVTGVEYPVPFATVYVEDTDCNLLSFQPKNYPWTWFFPFNCRREVIATAKTDACGNFCVWVPRFDIDWILRWRRERHCFPIIFKRPHIIDYIPRRKWPPEPIPGPDPAPFEDIIIPSLDTIGGPEVSRLKDEISRLRSSAAFGAIKKSGESLLDRRLFSNEMPPPLPADFQKALSGQSIVAAKEASANDAVRSAIGSRLGIGDLKTLEGFDASRFIGPFYKCIDVIVPEWQIILDVPDITFRVTQDTNGDGVEENIYSEGYFDVRWDAGAIPNITLEANANAKESHACNTPDIICGNVPAILFAGFMPLTNASYFNATTGYALRPNRPRSGGVPGGASTFPAQTPFCGALQLYGCVNVQKAVYYRFHQSLDNGATFSAITGPSWNNYTIATPIPIVADVSGWYPIDPINPITLSPVPRASLMFPNLLLDWFPPSQKILIKIELGDNARNHIVDSAVVAIVSDNTAPSIGLTKFAWKYVGESDGALRNLIGVPCPMIKRGVVPQDIELVFETNVSDQHLRDAALSTSGCGGGSFVDAPDPSNNPSFWYELPTDNAVVLYQRYRLSASTMPGCYSFACDTYDRAMNPSGGDGGNHLPLPDWFYDPNYHRTLMSLSVAVVNENL